MGNHENTAVGEFIRDYLDVDTEAVTRQLKETGAMEGKWMGEEVADARVGNRGDHYEGDFRKRAVEGCACGMPH